MSSLLWPWESNSSRKTFTLEISPRIRKKFMSSWTDSTCPGSEYVCSLVHSQLSLSLIYLIFVSFSFSWFESINVTSIGYDCMNNPTTGQHVALHDPNPEPGCIGHINTKMSPMLVAQNASEDARAICLREYGSAPDVKIYGDSQFTFPLVVDR